MDMKQMLIAQAQSSAHMVASAAKHIPAEKHNWSPGGVAQTPIWIVQHCADFPKWVEATIAAGEMAHEAPETPVSTMDEAVANLMAATEAYCGYIQNFPDAELGKMIDLPWASIPAAGVLGYQEWNNTYHLGQLNMLQMILGDAEMYLD